MSRATFRHVTLDSPVYRPGDHLVAITREGDIAGFVATQPQGLPEGDASPTLAGELMVILVDPALQRQGIGRALLDHALMAMDFRPSAGRYGFTWQRLLGENVGGIGALGVAEDRRERGIGLALAAYVTEVLQARGLETSFVGYTWLVDWYGKLGYQVWRDYCIGWVEISVGGG